MKTSDIIPCHALRPYISRYWCWDAEPELPTMLPGTGAELMFHYARPIYIQQKNGTSHSLPRSVLLSPRGGRSLLVADEPAGFVSVRFRSGALRHFCRMPPGELIDQQLSATDLWGPDGRQVETQVCAAGRLTERIRLIENFLLAQLQRCQQSSHGWLDDAFHQLYYHQSGSLDQAVARSGVSIRQFQKIFTQYAGVSPKYFQRVARMEVIVRKLLLTQNRRYLDLALDSGFYDQAHFIKDFRNFTGATPSHFLCDTHFRTHFYNPSLSH